ncbi:hypothetical protein LUZ60_008095 [Juncus effusus]|nr:hypothetical protein LUZ60_008095 [Juncus effusus]
MSLWLIPNVKKNSISQYTISVGDGFYYMTAGFHVYPALYKNYDLRFFTYWTADGGAATGCHNTRCPGFVVADEATLHPGQAIAPPLSTYNGEDYWAILSIKKDEQTQDWSLYRTSLGKTTLLGWWPKTLFESLTAAPKVQFNGMVSYILPNESPPMGSGHLAAEGERKAAYFKQITLYDTNGNGYAPSPSDMVSSKANGCYTVSSLEETKDDGLMFYYGRPSGCHS